MMRGLLLAWVCAGYSLNHAAGVSPTQKVIQLLQDMAAKGRAEKQDEEVRFAAYKQFCDDTSSEKKANIQQADEEIEQLQADIQKAEADAATLADEIAKLDADGAQWENDKKEATALREKEHKEFTVTHQDYSESIDALERAVHVLKQQTFDRKQASALIQEVAVLAKVPQSARKVLMAFLSTGSKSKQEPDSVGLGVSAPQANAYEFQSGGVVEMLEGLLDKFNNERNTLEKEEMASRQAFEMLESDLSQSIAAATKSRDEKAKTKAQRVEDAGGAKGDLADTTASRAEDKKYLDTLVAQCMQKSDDFAARQQLRAEELEAIQKAVEILSSGAVAGNDAKYRRLPSLAFLQAVQEPSTQEVATFLQARAAKLHSKVLELLSEQVQANPFGKVTKMIKDMITRLLEEANEEAEHKGWCDKEMGVNKQTRDDKTEQVNTLQAQLDQLKADIAQLAEQIADLTSAVAEIDAAVNKATKERQKEKAKNKETIEDSKEAQEAVSQALAVLKDFYAKAATATALVQGGAKADPAADAPETFDASYQGMGDNAGGVVGMLEVIASDFARLEAETNTAESEAQNEFERFMAESSKDKAVKSADMDHKKNSKVNKEGDANDTEKDLKGTQKELEAALFYYEKLKPSCLDAGVSYEDRVGRREEEIQSLREALEILGGPAA
jgi:uncharacterized protein YoxC